MDDMDALTGEEVRMWFEVYFPALKSGDAECWTGPVQRFLTQAQSSGLAVQRARALAGVTDEVRAVVYPVEVW